MMVLMMVVIVVSMLMMVLMMVLIVVLMLVIVLIMLVLVVFILMMMLNNGVRGGVAIGNGDYPVREYTREPRSTWDTGFFYKCFGRYPHIIYINRQIDRPYLTINICANYGSFPAFYSVLSHVLCQSTRFPIDKYTLYRLRFPVDNYHYSFSTLCH